MSIGPAMGIVASAAGTSLAQIKGSEPTQAQQTSNQQREAQSELLAAKAAGIGETAEDQPIADRDADGRRLWEEDPQTKKSPSGNDAPLPDAVKDPTGQRGNQIDLAG